MAHFLLDQFIRVEFDAMHCCSIAQSQLGPINIEHNNGGDDGDDGKADDHDIYIVTMFTIIHDRDDDCDYMTRP